MHTTTLHGAHENSDLVTQVARILIFWSPLLQNNIFERSAVSELRYGLRLGDAGEVGRVA